MRVTRETPFMIEIETALGRAVGFAMPGEAFGVSGDDFRWRDVWEAEPGCGAGL
jgi:hypothetical protein